MRLEPVAGLGVDHGSDVGRRIARVADDEFGGRALDQADDVVGDILLDEHQPQCRAALARRAER